MIDPPPASTRCGIANLQPRNAPLRLTAMMRSQTSSSRSGAGPSSGSQTPALLYRTCSAPNARTADCTAASTSADRVTSTTAPIADPPAARIQATVASTAAASRSPATT